MIKYSKAHENFIKDLPQVSCSFKSSLKHQNKILKSSHLLNKKYQNELKSQFECLTPSFSNSKHIIISVSGFCSEGEDEFTCWKGLLKSIDLPIYSYQWKSKSYLEIAQNLLNELRNFGNSIVIFLSKMLNITGFWLNVVSTAVSLGISIIQKFINAIDHAKASGKLLAHSLMLQYPFRGKSISLIGFSLGTQVIYSCLEELRKYDANHISKSSV